MPVTSNVRKGQNSNTAEHSGGGGRTRRGETWGEEGSQEGEGGLSGRRGEGAAAEAEGNGMGTRERSERQGGRREAGGVEWRAGWTAWGERGWARGNGEREGEGRTGEPRSEGAGRGVGERHQKT